MTEPIIAMELKIKLLDVKPATWRTIRVPLTIRYDQLHVLIQLAFGWENYHLYSFRPQGQDKEYLAAPDEFSMSPESDMLAKDGYVYLDVVQAPVIYTYDFGEDWQHEIKLNKVLTFAELGQQHLPSCVTGRGNNRLEDGNEGVGAPYDKTRIEEGFDLWAGAGEQLIRADDLGLFPGR